jgi:predicted aspartyl protease
MLRPREGATAVGTTAWVDTAFTGELVLPRREIERLGLVQSSAIVAGLADGNEVILEAYNCLVEWFNEERRIVVVESNTVLPLLGIGMLFGHKLEIDYRIGTLVID